MGRQKKNQHNVRHKSLQKTREQLLYFAALIIFVIPLIVFFKSVDIPTSAFFIYGPTEQVADFFAYYKAMVLQWGALILFIGALWVKWQDPNKTLKPSLFEGLLLAFASVVILSAVFSDFRDVAWFGWIERFEGATTWLAYLALAYSLHTLVKEKKDAHLLMGAFVLSSLVVSIIGVFQYVGLDLFQSDFGRQLILGPYYDQIAEALKFTFPKGFVYSTLYNPNYIGSVMSLAFPLALYMTVNSKKLHWRIIMGITPVFQLITLAGSKSATGFAAVGVSAVVFLLMLIFQHNATKKTLLIGLSMIAILLFGVYQLNLFDTEYQKIKNAMNFSEVEYTPFKEVIYNHPVLTVVIEDGTEFNLKPVGYDLEVTDQQGTLFERTDLEDRYTFNKQMNKYTLSVEKIHANGRISVNLLNTELQQSATLSIDLVQPDQFSKGYQLYTKEKLAIDVLRLIPREKAFTNRAYIWNRAIPQILNKPIVGHGADTFMLGFPHLDLIGQSVTLPEGLVDKPHNTYVQILYNFGFVGGAIFLCLLGYTFWQWKRSLLMSVLVGWLVVGFANDSTVFTTYMFFAIMGIAYVFKDAKAVPTPAVKV